MNIDEIPIGVPKLPTYPNDQNVGLSVPHPKSVDKSPEGKTIGKASETETKLSENHIQYSKTIGANDKTQAVAKQIREVDEAITQVSDNVHKMKSTLDGIIKVFPPYPKESSERVKALRQFSAFRKMIDQLTLPPPDDSPLKILGNSQANDSVGDWELDTGKGYPTLTIRHQPLHAGAGGLDIPELGTDASDAQLHDAADRLNKAQQTVELKHRNFVADANRVIKAML